jgi:hypothetical protein
MDPATPTEPMSEPLRRVMEALVAGLPAPPDAQAALSEDEKAQVAAMGRTSRLVKVALDKGEPPPGAEEAARARAQAALEKRPPTAADQTRFQQNNPDVSEAGGLRGWWNRLRRKRNDG